MTDQALMLAAVLLPFAGAAGILLLAATQFIEQGQRTRLLAFHREAADARERHDFARRHEAEHGVAVVAACFQRVPHGLDVILHEQHVDDDDVAVGNGTGARRSGRDDVSGQQCHHP